MSNPLVPEGGLTTNEGLPSGHSYDAEIFIVPEKAQEELRLP
jgi:hypothetical protein